MALTEEEKKWLDDYFNTEVSRSDVLKKYATVRDDLDKMRHFKEKGYGKSGTFDLTSFSASGSVVSLGRTGVNFGVTVFSRTIRALYGGFNLVQTAFAGNGDKAALKTGKAGFRESVTASVALREKPVVNEEAVLEGDEVVVDGGDENEIEN